ncbi:MAG: DUF805 domain-containing protein [Propylenella sp.]
MQNPFSFDGEIRPLPYALWSLGLFFSQHLLAFVILELQGEQVIPSLWLLAQPFRELVTLYQQAPTPIIVLALLYLLIVHWALAALAVRRAVNARFSGWIAAAAITPIVQLPVIVALCVMPPRSASDPTALARTPSADPGWVAAAQGVLAGIAFTVFAVAFGALVFGSYGFGLFVVAPFLIGALTAFLANRKGDLGSSRTAGLVMVTVMLGSVGLVLTALEGIVCIVMAAPLGLLIAWLGGLMGRRLAIASRGSGRQAMSAFVLLPVAFIVEGVFPTAVTFETRETILVNAPAELVWKAIAQMETIDAPLALPFRLGVAYPIRGEILGEGVGALRRGEFSTGVAVERVTEWVPNRKLAFVVLEDVPGMRELSPYENVNAPHVVGYFRTLSTSFELFERADGTTEIVERTAHQLRLDPILYWLPLARWVVHQNNQRVLTHVQGQTEERFAQESSS